VITFSKLGEKGNLGNQLFQIASTIGIATRNNQSYCFPSWKYSIYFENEFDVLNKNVDFESILEKQYCYSDIILEYKNFDLSGWFQTEKYFNVEKIKSIFQFNKEFLDNLVQNNINLFNKKNILISVRRGDFVNHPFYFQTNYQFYFLAIKNNFPDWKDRTLIFASDDISYCKFHFSFLKNAVFLENLSAIEQLALGSKCDDFVISNSTFSWWLAWLGEKNKTKIIRPIKNFRGTFALENNDKDFFPERWVPFDESKFHLDNEYIVLKIKGFFYQLTVDFKFYFFVYFKLVKNFIKKIIRW